MTAKKTAHADTKLSTLREGSGGKRRNPVATFMIRYGVLAVTVGLFIVFSFMSPRFASARNIFVPVSYTHLTLPTN